MAGCRCNQAGNQQAPTIAPGVGLNLRFATEGPIALRVAVFVAVFLVSGYAVVELAGPFADGPGRTRTVPPPIPPPGADDPLNRAILIEGGSFMRGSDDPGESTDPASPFATFDERPVRRVTVAGFWIQEHEVTNEEYRRFDAGHEFPIGRERHPVVNVTWREAMDYAASIGGSLPTETQWEFAARGTGSRKYPWGDSEPTCERAHYGACDPRGTIAVMARPDGATPEGIYGLAGNVWEWVVPVWFDPRTTPVNDASRRLRGGGFRDQAFFLRAANRNNDFFRGFEGVDIGFRVVWPLEAGRD